METKRLGYLLLVVAILLGLIGVSSASAKEQAGILPAQQQARPEPRIDIDITLVTTDTEIFDLSGNPFGIGTHGGRLTCNGDNCNHWTQLSFQGTEYEYKYSTRVALDPDAKRVVVGGTGTISKGGQKERFSFNATFEFNLDGTVVSVRYEASNPNASFSIPSTPGRFEIRSR
jgi:hypothetical protein